MPERSVIQGPDGPITVGIFGSDFTVQMDATSLLLTIAPDFVAPTWRVNLDGTPSEHVRVGPGEWRLRTIVTARWDGDSLTLLMAQEEFRNGKTVRNKTFRRLTLNADSTLRVERPDGDTGRNVASVYRWLAPMP